MTLNELAAIAARHLTRMADAMIDACIKRAIEMGEHLEIPERSKMHRRGTLPQDDPTDEEWRRMVEGNSDSRWSHV